MTKRRAQAPELIIAGGGTVLTPVARPKRRRPTTVFLFGPKGVGVSSVGNLLSHPDVLPDVGFAEFIEGETAEQLLVRMAELHKEGARTVLVGGRPSSAADLRALAQVGLADPVTAMIFRLWRNDLADGQGEFAHELGFIVATADVLSMPISVIVNDQLDHCAGFIAARAKLEEK